MKCKNPICKNDVRGRVYCSSACKQRFYRIRKKGEQLNPYFYKSSDRGSNRK